MGRRRLRRGPLPSWARLAARRQTDEGRIVGSRPRRPCRSFTRRARHDRGQDAGEPRRIGPGHAPGRLRHRALLAWKERLADGGEHISLEDLIIDRTVSTLRDHPGLNGSLKDREIHLHDAVHLGVAIALPGNLLFAPAIFDADLKSLAERANARKDLAERAKTNKLTVAEMTGATFTVTNLGRSRVRYFTRSSTRRRSPYSALGRCSIRRAPDRAAQSRCARRSGFP